MAAIADTASRKAIAGPEVLPALAARAQLGDRNALEALLRHLQAPIGDHIRGIVRDDDGAADVLQEVLIIICKRLGTLRDTAWVRAWAYRIATREAWSSLRRAHRWQELPADDTPDLSVAVEASWLADEELLQQLPARLASLPPGAQIVLRMHYLQSLTQQEVAAALEIPLGTVKSRLAYGLATLRKTMAPD